MEVGPLARGWVEGSQFHDLERGVGSEVVLGKSEITYVEAEPAGNGGGTEAAGERRRGREGRRGQ